MPSNSDFKLDILVADTPVPDYSKDGEHFVECNLSTPVSYMHRQSDSVNGETEVQSWPVTPYRIRIKASPMSDSQYPKYFRVLIDGVKVKGISLDPGESKVIKGFRDGPSIREFLFSMPRYAKDLNDRLETSRYKAVGKIVVECWDAVLRRSKWSLRSKYLDFKQANKKDSSQVTEGKYMMATSCPGKVVSGRAIHRLVDSWKLQTLRSTITVSYHMGHTLQEMGFTLRSLEIPPENLRAQEGSGVSGDSVVKKELMDLPEIPKPKEGEVIDLTEDKDIARSSEETAMDLSVKSTGDNKPESGSHSDDGYNSDNLCIVEDEEPGEETPNPSRTEEEPNVNTDIDKNPADNTVQTDEKVESSPEDVEMVEGEHPVNENEDNDMDTEKPCAKENEGDNEVEMTSGTDKEVDIGESKSTLGENKSACAGSETGAEKDNALEQSLHNSEDEMVDNNPEDEIESETSKQVENDIESKIESTADKEVDNNENNVEPPNEKESKSSENETPAKVTDDIEQDSMETKPADATGSSETFCEDLEKNAADSKSESEIGSEGHAHPGNKDESDKEINGISKEASSGREEVSAQKENESEKSSSDTQSIGHSEDRLDDEAVLDGGEEDEFQSDEDQEPTKEMENDNEQKDDEKPTDDNT